METETEYKLMTNTVNRRYQLSDTADFYCQTLSSQNKNPNPSPIREKFGSYLCGEAHLYKGELVWVSGCCGIVVRIK